MTHLIDFSQLGGYRLEQPTFDKMQATYYAFLKAMIGHFGIADTGSFIISGCEISGADILPGIMYIDGHLCEFAGSPGTLATKIKKLETTGTLAFENGTTPIVFTEYSAVVDAAGALLSSFIRVPSPFNLPANIVIDALYNNFSTAEKAKLLGIEAGAEVNVQPDWAETNPAVDSFVRNKPVGRLMTFLKQGVYIHGDLMTNYQQVTIAFGDVGTDQYKVLGNLVGSGSSPGGDARINFVIREKTSTSFKLAMNDLGDVGGQSVRFEYALIPDDNS